MSIFGSGRREGILTVLGLAAFALSVHGLGAAFGLADGFEGDLALARGMQAAHQVALDGGMPLWDPAGAGAPLWASGAEMMYPPWWLLGRGHDAFWLPVLAALHAAIACALAFRFLRVQGRSRYASFVCGAAYGLSAHTGRMSGSLPELAALAWAPLVLELLLRVVRGERQRHLAPLLGPAIAWMFCTGGVATGLTVLAVAIVWYLGWSLRERHRLGSLLVTGAVSLGIAATLLAPMWLGAIELPRAPSDTHPRVDALLNARLVCGPLLLFFAMLGAMRRQRGAPTMRWLALAGLGAIAAIALPFAPSPLHGEAPWQRTPDALWWPVHFALVLLASNGLDDFLDMPVRRRAATVWTLVFAVCIAPIGFVLGEHGAWLRVEGAVTLALASLFLLWRSLGIAAALLAPMWLGAIELPRVPSDTHPRVDALLNARLVCGPLLLFFAMLGAMRRQRGAPTMRWLALAGLGAAAAIALPFAPSPLHGEAPWQRTPDALWWPVHFALVLLASNGLDDFLDMPVRRRAATVWTLVFAVMIAPAGFVLGEHGAWLRVEGAVMLALASLFLLWRSLGILRFKTVVAAAALVWLSVATLREHASTGRAPCPVPTLAKMQPHPWLFAAPTAETAVPTAPPPRARIEFDLRSDSDSGEPAPIDPLAPPIEPVPHPGSGSPTLVHALPSWFVPRRDAAATAEFLGETSRTSDYRAHLPEGAGALVVDDTWTPGWRAYVDGREVECLTTECGARAVLLDSGMHMVRFEYRPLAESLGIQLAVGGCSFAGVWSLFALVRLWFSSRKNTSTGLRTKKAKRPPTMAKPAIATKAPEGANS